MPEDFLCKKRSQSCLYSITTWKTFVGVGAKNALIYLTTICLINAVLNIFCICWRLSNAFSSTNKWQVEKKNDMNGGLKDLLITAMVNLVWILIQTFILSEELWVEVCDIVQEAAIKILPKKKKYKRAKWLSEAALQIPEKRREAKGKGEKER